MANFASACKYLDVKIVLGYSKFILVKHNLYEPSATKASQKNKRIKFFLIVKGFSF